MSERKFDHSKRKTKFLMPGFGFCVCEDCQKLPEHEKTHLQIITEAYDKCDVKYVIRNNIWTWWQYLFLYGKKEDKLRLEHEPISNLTKTERFMEFYQGSIASY